MNQMVDLSAWIGRTEKVPADIVTPRMNACFAATFGDMMAGVEGAPAGLHWCLSPPTAIPNDLGPDGHPAKGGFLPPVPLPRRMWASGSVEFLSALRVGDVVKKSSKIKSIDWKTGKTGQMCFVTVAHEYASERGVAIREDQNIVYRAAPDGSTARPEPKRCEKFFDQLTEIDVDTVRLFRYSAMTFNAHRIHYDLPYATDVEHYPDLVVHGPLQATLLLNFAARSMDCMPKKFSFRGVAPATGVQTLKLGLSRTKKNEFSMSVIGENGAETMTGSATW